MGHNHSHKHIAHASDARDEYNTPERASESEEETTRVPIQKYLRAVDYPATKDDLIESAEEKGADDTVLETLNDLPEKEFENSSEVRRAMRHTD